MKLFIESSLLCFLTEPQAHDPVVEFYAASNALKELNKEVLVCVHSSSVANDLQSQMPGVKGVPGLCSSCCEFTETLTSGSSSAKEPTMEDFTALSPEHIECSSIGKLSVSFGLTVTMRVMTPLHYPQVYFLFLPLPFCRYSDSTGKE